MNKYPENSPIPNWPKKIKKKNLSIYCTPVNQAIINGLKNIGEEKILKKFLSPKRDELTDKEIKIINEGYQQQVNIILMKSDYNF